MKLKANQRCSFFALEAEDFLIYLAGLGLSILTWMLILGWNFDLLIPGHDGPNLDLPYLSELARSNGEWKSILYRTSWLGGVKLYSVTGLSWCLSLLLRLGFTPYMAMNSFIFFIQSVYAYLGIKSVRSLLMLWKVRPIYLSWYEKLPLIWLFAFAPVIGWRFCFGHSTVAMASQFFITLLAGLISAMAGTTTVFLSLLSIVVVNMCLQSTMAQPILYGVVFGAPILFGLFWSEFQKDLKVEKFAGKVFSRPLFGKWLKIFCKGFGPAVIGLLLALDSFSLFLTQSASGDTARSFKAGSVTYSYLTGQLMDWVGSILWTLNTVKSDLPIGMRHEVNYPMGPLLLMFIFLFPWRKYWGEALGLLVSFFLIIAFSNNVEMISGPLMALVPPLQYFRVPTRSALVVALVLPIYATASFLNVFESKRSQFRLVESLLCIGIASTLFFLSPTQREVVLWVGLAIQIGFYLINQKSPISPWCLILVLGVGSVLAFGERRLDFLKAGNLMAESSRIHDHVVAQAPELGFPLTRGYLGFVLPAFDTNTGFGIGISSLSGYGFPLRRYLQFVLAFNGETYDPTLTNLNIPLDTSKYQALRLLYNVKYDLDLTASQEVKVTAGANTFGPAWFVDSLESVQDFEKLVERLKDFGKAKVTGFLIQDDAAIPPSVLKWPSQPGCKNSQVIDVSSYTRGQSFEFRVNTEAECPLVVSTNYSSQWSAYLLEDGIKKVLPVFPVYGALVGILVPPGASQVMLDTEISVPVWAQFGKLVGWFLLGLIIFSPKITFLKTIFN
jgi:hypothetical protein